MADALQAWLNSADMIAKELFNFMAATSWQTWIPIALASVMVLVRLFGTGSKKLNLPPGPGAWPILGSLPSLGAEKTPHRAFAALARKYGPVMHVRMGSVPAIVVSNAQMAEEVLRNQDSVFANRPYMAAGKYLGFNNNMVAFASMGPHFSKIRKIYSLHILSAQKVQSFKGVREEEVRAMVKFLAKDSAQGKEVNVTNKLLIMNPNNMTRMIFGKRLFGDESDSGAEAAEFRSAMRDTTELLVQFNLGDYIPALKPFDLQGIERKMKDLQRRLEKIVQVFIKEHRERNKGVRKGDVKEDEDIIDVFLKLQGEDAVSDETIIAVALELLVGGSESSASAVEWALSELLRHHNCILKAQQELDTVIGRNRLVEEADIPKLPYLQAVLKEAFRLHPPGPLGLPHASLQATKIGKYDIPANSTVYLNLWAIGRDPENWQNPEEFSPDRFENSKLNLFGQDFQLLPFASGRRRCPGMNLALAMAHLALANLLHAFEWPQLKSEEIDMTERFGGVTVRAAPLIVSLKPRLPEHVY
ncbi:hypothetical protein O6H91_03G019300 [Diphasiastrum complanatum]|uniref:Uncharacterized protein n=1 Tax=Diphasiastrum complanatum TaxID=34168 RepID=A0ACC2E493_DIPCM|nr:hypothetical protein O6H91_03G019300 [Diphasiastrum complanatum]